MSDPIVEEVRRVRDAHAARFNYDLDAIFRDIKEQEQKSGFRFVAGVARLARPNPSPPTGPAAVGDSLPVPSTGPAER